MIKTTIEKLADEIGFEIGASDDVTQCKLLNSFFRGLADTIKDSSSLVMHICYINRGLSNDLKRLITSLYEFIKLENKNEKIYK